MTKLRVADLFCGLGSFHRAAKALGHEVVFAADLDPRVREVYRETHGLEPAGDIGTVDWGAVPDFDVLCAGPPCQSFSTAGRRGGLGDARGDLILKIADVLRAKRPRWFVVENVPGLVTIDAGEAFRTVLRTYKDAGYRVKWAILRSHEHGLPLFRRRVFVVGSRDGEPWTPPPPMPFASRPTLSEALGRPFKARISRSPKTTYNSTATDKRQWARLALEDGLSYCLTADDVQRLMGWGPDEIDWGRWSSRAARIRMLGNSIPTCLSHAVLAGLGVEPVEGAGRAEDEGGVGPELEGDGAVPLGELELDGGGVGAVEQELRADLLEQSA